MKRGSLKTEEKPQVEGSPKKTLPPPSNNHSSFKPQEIDLLGVAEDSSIKWDRENDDGNQKTRSLNLLELNDPWQSQLGKGLVKQVPLEEVLSDNQQGVEGKSGLQIKGRFCRDKDQIYLELSINNKSKVNLRKIEVFFSANHFGLKIKGLENCFLDIEQCSQFKYNILTNDINSLCNTPPSLPLLFMMTLKCDLDTFCFYVPMMFHNLLVKKKRLLLRNL